MDPQRTGRGSVRMFDGEGKTMTPPFETGQASMRACTTEIITDLYSPLGHVFCGNKVAQVGIQLSQRSASASFSHAAASLASQA